MISFKTGRILQILSPLVRPWDTFLLRAGKRKTSVSVWREEGDLDEQGLDLRISIALPYYFHFGEEKPVIHFLESMIKLTLPRNMCYVVNL